MRDIFYGYYAPSQGDYDRLWNESIIVLDTNVLLNLYRLPARSRDEFIAVLEALKDRLWLPYQVALEFQRRRLTVISGERKATEDALDYARRTVAELKLRVENLEIDNRGLGLESRPLIEDLEKANAKLMEAVSAVHKAQIDIASSDPIRDKLDSLFTGKVGVRPTSQAELDVLTADGEERFTRKIPPGFADASKEKNPNEAIFIHDKLNYQRKFGDLILWRQLINHVKDNGSSSVILVTADKKDDWWWREQGKTVGPHPELVCEIHDQGALGSFWMYSADQFLDHASRFAKIRISDKAVAEVQGVTASAAKSVELSEFLDRTSNASVSHRITYSHSNFKQRKAEELVASWLLRLGREVIRSNRFPDITVREVGGPHGYEVKFFDKLSFSSIETLIQVARRGYEAIVDGNLRKFTMFICISVSSKDDLTTERRAHEIEDFMIKLERVLRRYPEVNMILARINSSGRLSVIFEKSGSGTNEDFTKYTDNP
jgi:hypothetical protein